MSTPIPPASDDQNALIGRLVADKYLVESLVGVGAMGSVYRALQVSLDRRVALKVAHRSANDRRGFSDAFLREAQAASKLEHPNSVQILDYGEEPDGLLYIAMEFLDGRDLYSVIEQEHPLDEVRIVAILSQVLGALAVAHDLGIIHRDLKPENIMVLERVNDEGQRVDAVKVCDFGIAKVLAAPGGTGDERRRTTRGLVVGTPEYMSPEQAQGHSLDARSDLYAVGVILYHLVVGDPPFVGETAIAIVLQHVSATPEPPSKRGAAVNPELEAICLRALQKDRELRFSTAREMRAALRATVAGREAYDLGAVSSRRGPGSRRATPGEAATSGERALGSAPTVVSTAVRVESPATTITGAIHPFAGEPPASSRRGWLLGGGALLTLAAALAYASTPRSRGPEATTVASAVAVPSLASPASLGSESASATGAPSAAPALSAARLNASPLSSGATPTSTNSLPPLEALPHERLDAWSLRVDAAAATDSAGEDLAAASPTESAEPPLPAPPLPTPSALALASAVPVASASVVPTASAPVVLAEAAIAAATVSISGATATNGISGGSVRASLNVGALTRCYRDALRGRAAAVTGSATLALSIDETGRVTDAQLEPAAFFPQLRACVEAVGKSARVKGVDTGDGTARVNLVFSVP